MLLKPLNFHSPTTLQEATKLYSELGDVKILAGGTFLMNSLKMLKRKGIKTPQHVISLKKIKDLQGIHMDGDKLIIKAMTVINDLYDSPLLTDNFKVLRKVCKNISTHPIRNMATVGGNLTCRYTWTEMGAVMIGLDAQMHFMGIDGKEEVLPAEDFFKNAAKTTKIFSHVSIKKDPTALISYQRVKKTMHVDVPMLCVFVKANFNGNNFANTRVSINNCVTFAQRDYTLEEFLNKSECRLVIEEAALDHLNVAIYDTRSDDYKKYMFRTCIKHALAEITENKKKIKA